MGSYINREGKIQRTLDLGVNNNLDGRNFQEEEAQAKAERQAKRNKPKNPNRVEGGKKARVTIANKKQQALINSPILKALNYDLKVDNNSLSNYSLSKILNIMEAFLNEQE